MQINYLGPLDLISAFIWLIIILVVMQMRYSANQDKEHFKYYRWNVLFKLFFGLIFAAFYVFYYRGGDTVAYWEGAVKLNNLFFKSPVLYLQEMWQTMEPGAHYWRFNQTTGYPPGWIYREPEGWYISKIASMVSFITFKSFWAATMLFGFVLANASWRLYELVLSFKLHRKWHAALAVLFIPSVSFWCATVSKDAVVLISIFYIIVNLFRIISIEQRSTVWNWVGVVFFTYILLQTRSAIAMAVYAPLLFALVARVRRQYRGNPIVGRLLSSALLAIGFAGFAFFLTTQGEVLQAYIDEAALVQQDFAQNKTYGQNRYDLGITDYTPAGLLRVFPAAVLAGTFRPFIWEALSPTLILNGLESLFFMYLTLLFFFGGSLPEKIARIRRSEFLMFAFYFVLLMAFMAGFTGVIFGVLVRFKAAVLPFLVLVLTAHLKKSMTNDKLPMTN